MLFVSPLLSPASVATGHYVLYCDAVGISLAKIDGAPVPGKFVLFFEVSFPPGTVGGQIMGRGEWSHVYVLRDGCVPAYRCESIAEGKVWIDAPDTQHLPPKHISGKYEIDLNGKHLEGTFLAKRKSEERPLRLCM
jgi:hypothetical protein